MPRACVIVLDAVGAGELPDAADWGDEGSDTLGNVARAVGGLDLPNLEALGLGNVEPLEGCPPQPYAPAVAGRLLERSKGKDTTAGHWELMGVVTPTPFPTYPYGFPDEVIDPFMNRTGRGVLGNRPASGTEIIQELGEEHQRTGKWIVYTSADSVFQIAAHEETIPLEELYAGCRIAREILTGKHAVGRVIARPFIGEPGHYERTPNRHDFSLEPRRPNYLTAIREAGNTVYGVGKISDIFAGCDIDESFTTKSNVDGINRTIELLENVDSGLVFVNLVETDQLLGPPQRPGELPPVPAGLRPAPAGHPRRAPRRRPPDPHVGPRLRPDDALDRPLARARAAPRIRGREERRRQDPRGRRVRRRRRHHQHLARREAPGKGRPGPADPRAVRINDPGAVREQYATEDGLAARKSVYRNASGPDARELAVEAVLEVGPSHVLEVGCGEGELAERLTAEVADARRDRPVAAHGGAHAGTWGGCPCGRRRGAAFPRRELRRRAGRVDALPRGRHRPGPRRDRPRPPPGRAPRRRDECERSPRGAPSPSVASGAGTSPFHADNGAEILGRHFAAVERRDAFGVVTFDDIETVRAYLGSSRHLASGLDVLPGSLDEPVVARRRPTVFVATKHESPR